MDFDMIVGTPTALDKTFSNIIKTISSPIRDQRFLAVQEIRKILSVSENPPIDRVIENGFVPILHKYLLDERDPQLQYESSWALTNIASGNSQHTAVLFDNEVHKSLIDLLSLSSGKDAELCEQCVWALGNFIGESSHYRNSILEEGIIPILINIINSRQTKKSLISNIAWTMSNINRGNPRPSFHHFKQLIPSVVHLLSVWSKDSEIISDIFWSLSFLTETPKDEKEIFDTLIESGIVDTIISILLSNDPSSTVTVPGFRTLGNMLAGEDYVTSSLLKSGILRLFPIFLNSTKATLVKETFWSMSNISSGTPPQIQELVDHGLLLDAIRFGFISTVSIETSREVLWTIVNAVTGANEEQILYLLQNSVVKCLETNFQLAKSQPNLYGYYLDSIVGLLKKTKKIQTSGRFSKVYESYIAGSFIESLIESKETDTDEHEIKFCSIEMELTSLKSDSDMEISNQLSEMEIQ